jgi:hypothetical protein
LNTYGFTYKMALHIAVALEISSFEQSLVLRQSPHPMGTLCIFSEGCQLQLDSLTWRGSLEHRLTVSYPISTTVLNTRMALHTH